MFKKSGSFFSPGGLRYSYAFRVKGKNIIACSKYYLEKDFNLMRDKFGIDIHLESLKLTGAAWEEAAYEQLKWFKGNAAQATDKLITCKGKNGSYYGWYYKEIYPDNPVK